MRTQTTKRLMLSRETLSRMALDQVRGGVPRPKPSHDAITFECCTGTCVKAR